MHDQFNPWASDDQQGSGQRECAAPGHGQPGQGGREDPPGQFGQPGYDHEEPGFNRQGYVPNHPYQPPAGDRQEWFDTTPVAPIGRHPAADQAFTERERIEREITAVAAHGVAEPPPGRGRRLPGPIGLAAVVAALLVTSESARRCCRPASPAGDGDSGSDVRRTPGRGRRRRPGRADASRPRPSRPRPPAHRRPAPRPRPRSPRSPSAPPPSRSPSRARAKPQAAPPPRWRTRSPRWSTGTRPGRLRHGPHQRASCAPPPARHSQDMADRNYFSHDIPGRPLAVGPGQGGRLRPADRGEHRQGAAHPGGRDGRVDEQRRAPAQHPQLRRPCDRRRAGVRRQRPRSGPSSSAPSKPRRPASARACQ